MKVFTYITLFFAAITIKAVAQAPITGLIIDDADGEPMAGVSVTIRDDAGKINNSAQLRPMAHLHSKRRTHLQGIGLRLRLWVMLARVSP